MKSVLLVDREAHTQEDHPFNTFPVSVQLACQWFKCVFFTAFLAAFHRGLHNHKSTYYFKKHCGKSKVWAKELQRTPPHLFLQPQALLFPLVCAVHSTLGVLCSTSRLAPLPANSDGPVAHSVTFSINLM